MLLINLQAVTHSFGHPPILDAVNLSIYRGERVCLIGRNGAGKSTLLKILDGQVKPDEGSIKKASGVKIGQLEQTVPETLDGSVFDVIASGLGEEGALIKRYHELIQAVATAPNPRLLDQLETCQTELERINGWDIAQRVDSIITKMDLVADAQLSTFSGGFKRRVLLARALVGEPDLLLLDEPTNHLDIEAITWIEQFLLKWDGALLFISHDRSFMQAMATRFLEIDRGQLIEYTCNYNEYLERKQTSLETEDRHNALFDYRLSKEERWIRQGIKARRTRNEGRVRALEGMRREYAERRMRQGKVKMDITTAEKSGKSVAEAKKVSFCYADATVVQNFSTRVQRGDKIGLIGRNGVGKSTLLKLLLGHLQPQEGHIKIGTNLRVAYFDQYRLQLENVKSVQDNVADGRDMLEIAGKSRHVISYLQDFLFSPERCRQPVSALSGGERNRLLLARLFAQPSNVLVLDEPTNDLDIETLELLEELLIKYSGTVFLVSHDRSFLDNVVTSTLVFEGSGTINNYVGGYNDWLRQRSDIVVPNAKVLSDRHEPQRGPKTATKLSYRDQRELEALPKKIEVLEEKISALCEQLSHPDHYRSERSRGLDLEQQLKQSQMSLDNFYLRWEELDQS